MGVVYVSHVQGTVGVEEGGYFTTALYMHATAYMCAHVCMHANFLKNSRVVPSSLHAGVKNFFM